MSDNADTAESVSAGPQERPEMLSDHQAQLNRRRTTLLISIAKLKSQIKETEAQLQEVNSRLRSHGCASQIVREHIQLLHAYNEIRDIGQGLLGMLADARGVRHVDVQKEFGVGAED